MEPTQTSQEQAPVTVESLSGFNEGHELQSEGQTYVIKGDRDENGNVIGWHKELKQEGQV